MVRICDCQWGVFPQMYRNLRIGIEDSESTTTTSDDEYTEPKIKIKKPKGFKRSITKMIDPRIRGSTKQQQLKPCLVDQKKDYLEKEKNIVELVDFET